MHHRTVARRRAAVDDAMMNRCAMHDMMSGRVVNHLLRHCRHGNHGAQSNQTSDQ